ncbi:MAG: hypothetical protein COU85_01765 [Candidatus Portnoybacteria bacterium CG10_big_fil_rev_8_21_14_0_10_44_7]|uniref:Heat-inducible transcription repressor HrcA C-terminal domain-containing protein n=1 Tax=Candidatus Portnoybacteria bacterium CG10_big_fil_rev_8_21_14_0_10_44_7 TaxID=1974816 RepID=A0A2M8KIQ7_9BACT|nr:MAG: hypothetical protein COU85_01765 [Candidatus Portnoybacteria bacterium CG10_big_fil_rev_8_21_14_0_10_44_7]
MQPRQRKVLKSIVKEYCRTGEPVGSLFLAEKHTFSYSPATIRGEMSRLERKGYLTHPHTSAGRTPTDKGFRFFIDELMDQTILLERERQVFIEYVSRFLHDQNQLLRGASRALARISRNLGFGVLPHKRAFYSSGYGDLLRALQEENIDQAADIFGFFENDLEKKIERLFRNLDQETRVFIGAENPLKEFKNCSLVVGCGCLNDQGEKILVGVLGPKKMDYAKNISLVGELAGWFGRRNKKFIRNQKQ